MLCLFLLILALTGALEASYRLPKNVMPESYKLEIFSYLGEKDNFDFDGRVWITTSCVSPTTNITLHSKNLEIYENEIKIRDVTTKLLTEIKNFKVTFDKSNEFLILLLEEPLIEDHKYEIKIIFKGTMNDGLAGFYRSSYVDKKTKEKKWLGVTQFEAISARRAFPCFDEPEFKATFDINIARKEGLRAISNMPLVVTEPVKEKPGYYWDRFDISVPMSTYLVAYVVSDFEYQESDHKDSNVTFKIWARKDLQHQTDFAKDVGPKALQYFANFFNIEYPLPKQDMVAIPDFSAGAMENWGLITYRESALLFDPEKSTATSKHNVANVIAHELAHQWFGNLVTMKWWTDLWLNEGFATYMAAQAVEHLFPQWNSLEEETSSNILVVFAFDSLRTSHPVSIPLTDPNRIDEIFDTISYQKGSSLIRMMSLFLGEETLQKGVNNYLREHRYSNAEQDDLWNALTKAGHEKETLPKNLTVKTIMDTWTIQTGYPVIHVDRDYDTGSVVISQERFLRDTLKSKTDEQSCWWVPLSYSTKSNPNFESTSPKFWLSCPHSKNDGQHFDISLKGDEWLIFNNKMSGLYRVNYDEKNWQLITKTLQSAEFKKINNLNRVQLINDAAMLAFVGKLKYDIFFDLVKYVENESEYLPWKSVIGKIQGIEGYLKGNSSYGLLKSYMKKLISPVYEKLGGLRTPKEEGNHRLDKIKMQQLISAKACRYDLESCVKSALGMFKKFMGQPADQPNPIPKDIRSVVYCQALKHGNEVEWDFLWQVYKNSDVATEKGSILGSLGCTEEIWLLNRYLEWSLDDSKIRKQDTTKVFSAVATKDVGYYVAKDFLYKNIDRMYKVISPNYRHLTRFLNPIANDMSHEEDLKEFEAFIHQHENLFSKSQQGVDQALEGVKINIQWQKLHGGEISNILKKYVV